MKTTTGVTLLHPRRKPVNQIRGPVGSVGKYHRHALVVVNKHARPRLGVRNPLGGQMTRDDQFDVMEACIHGLPNMRNPEEYVATLNRGDEYGERILRGLAYIRRFAQDKATLDATARGMDTKTCSCCGTAQATDSFRQRTDSRYQGKRFAVSQCWGCERAYMTRNKNQRSLVKQNRILAIREEAMEAANPALRAEMEAQQRMVASRLAHGFLCGCAECNPRHF